MLLHAPAVMALSLMNRPYTIYITAGSKAPDSNKDSNTICFVVVAVLSSQNAI